MLSDDSKLVYFENIDAAFARLERRIQLIENTPTHEALMDHLLQTTITAMEDPEVSMVEIRLDGNRIGDPIPAATIRAGHSWLDEQGIDPCLISSLT